MSVIRKPADYRTATRSIAKVRLVSGQHGARRVIRTEHDGSLTVLADRFDGKRFNSPNDVVVKSMIRSGSSPPPPGRRTASIRTTKVIRHRARSASVACIESMRRLGR